MANPNPPTDHLPKIKPGEVRNPLGINNKNKRFTDALIKILDDANLDKKFVAVGLEHAIKRADFNFWKYIYERIEGKIPEAPEPEPEVTMEEVAKRLRDKKKPTRKKPE